MRPRPRTAAAAALLLCALGWVALSCRRAGVLRAPDPLPRHVRHALVLDGQGPSGSRAFHGLELVRSGLADTVVLSGVEIGGGMFYSILWARMLPLAPRERGLVLEMRSNCRSTHDEARLADSVFAAMGDDTVVVVTSAYHAWRTASVFRNVARRGTVFVVESADDPEWDKGLTDREARKMRLMEWTKRIHWTLWEQWTRRRGPLPRVDLARGSRIGELPPPAWR